MTIRELRQMLTRCENQQITIKELRNILFEVDEQDEELTWDKMERLTYTKPEPIYYQIKMASGSFSEVRTYQPVNESDYFRCLEIFEKNPKEYHRVF